MRKVKLAGFLLIAVFAVGVVAAASASASTQPLFLTASGNTLLFTATGGLAILLGSKLGQKAEIHCEKSSGHGNILNKSSLADEVNISFSGKCVETAAALGLEKAACTEPISIKLARGELGLESNNDVGLVLKPASGEEFVTTSCGGSETKVSGEIIGTFPETSKYNKLESEAELVFNASGTTQEPTAIELLGTSMTKVELKVNELFGEKASEITKAVITPDGKVAIDS